MTATQIKTETKNSTYLNQASLEEIVETCVESPNGFNIDFLAAQADHWVLVTTVREADELRGFSFFTLDRIGGTPCVLVGLAYICRTDTRSIVLANIVNDQMRRASLSFPDEDVLFSTQINNSGAFEVFDLFHNVVPRPDFNPTGEDRAWGRRLAKRLGISMFSYEDRSFVARSKQLPPVVFDHVSIKPAVNALDTTSLLEKLEQSDGDTLIVHGWAKAEQLAKLTVVLPEQPS
ncbi:MAG: hypothetical protein OXI96_02245 [Acidimicrobiaceae bacterium]|nr:hypothetical protein [Acidimicrobiaceae bacterium]